MHSLPKMDELEACSADEGHLQGGGVVVGALSELVAQTPALVWLSQDEGSSSQLRKALDQFGGVGRCANCSKVGVLDALRGDRDRDQLLHALRIARIGLLGSAPIIVLSFLPRAFLAQGCSALQEGVPGVRFLQAPFSLAEFREHVRLSEPLTSDQLIQVRRWHCGLQEDWARVGHDLGHALPGWPEQREWVRELLARIEPDIRQLAPDQVPALEAVYGTLEGTEAEVRAAIQALSNGIRGKGEEPPPAPFDRPPKGFDSIMVADDRGYAPETLARLQQLGYFIVPKVARCVESACLMMENAAPSVVLADLHLPRRKSEPATAAAGRELLQAALQADSVRLVIAISAAAATNELPEGVEDCCGPEYSRDAERIHRLIWRRARQEGVERHA